DPELPFCLFDLLELEKPPELPEPSAGDPDSPPEEPPVDCEPDLPSKVELEFQFDDLCPDLPPRCDFEPGAFSDSLDVSLEFSDLESPFCLFECLEPVLFDDLCEFPLGSERSDESTFSEDFDLEPGIRLNFLEE